MNLKYIFLAFFLAFASLQAQISNEELDNLIINTLKTFDVPGISVGIIKDGQMVYAKGHGVRSLNNQKPMDDNTLVGIASNSKGFTCTALAILSDEGKLDWEDKVTKYIPEFSMYDPYMASELTIKDLVTHRAGLGLGQGDLMFFPEGGTLSIEDIIHNIRYLKPQHSLRNTLDYNNIMFIVAGEIINRVSGQTWAEFIENKIMKPVGMNNSYGSYNRALTVENKIDAHAPADGIVKAVAHDWNETANAAGGIMSNIVDMSLWADFLMNGFLTKDGVKLVSEKNANYLWNMQMPLPVSANGPYKTHFNGYGLGWFLSDVNGQFQVQHSGGLIGTVTHFTLLPEMELGIIVLTNQQSGLAFSTLTNTIKDSYLGIKDRNWLSIYKERNTKNNQLFDKQKKDVFDQVEKAKISECRLKAEQITGTYRDAWFGDILISADGKKLNINCKSSPRLTGELLPYSSNTYVVKWQDRSYDADAFIIFEMDEKGKVNAAKMKAISDITDFSFDFQDLDLKRVE